MRVMLDTNVLISAFVFDSPTIGRVIRDVATRQQLVLCTFVVDEFREVVARKWPARRAAAERFLERASYETVAGFGDLRQTDFSIKQQVELMMQVRFSIKNK